MACRLRVAPAWSAVRRGSTTPHRTVGRLAERLCPMPQIQSTFDDRVSRFSRRRRRPPAWPPLRGTNFGVPVRRSTFLKEVLPATVRWIDPFLGTPLAFSTQPVEKIGSTQ